MRSLELEGELLERVVRALGKTRMFYGLEGERVRQILSVADLIEYQSGEVLMAQDTPSDSFFLVLSGEASVTIDATPEPQQIAVLKSYDVIGEMGVLLEQPRSANVVADARVLALRFKADTFKNLFQKVPGFAVAVCRTLADRVHHAFRRIPIQITIRTHLHRQPTLLR